MQQSYGLILFLFRGQPNNYNCLVTNPFHLQCYPRLIRFCGVPLAYSTSNPKIQDANRFSYSIYFIPLSRFILRTISRPSFHSQSKPTVKDQYVKERCSPLRTLCSGNWTRTSDLRVMSPTSYLLLYPAMCIFIFLISYLFYKDMNFFYFDQIFL